MITMEKSIRRIWAKNEVLFISISGQIFDQLSWNIGINSFSIARPRIPLSYLHQYACTMS